MKLLIVWRLEESSGVSYHLSVQRVKMQTEREFKICLWKLQEWDRGEGGDGVIETFFFQIDYFSSGAMNIREIARRHVISLLTSAWESEL